MGGNVKICNAAIPEARGGAAARVPGAVVKWRGSNALVEASQLARSFHSMSVSRRWPVFRQRARDTLQPALKAHLAHERGPSGSGPLSLVGTLSSQRRYMHGLIITAVGCGNSGLHCPAES